MRFKTKDMIQCAVFAAILCVFSIITIPAGAIPFTLGVLGILLCAIILGCKKSVISVLVFILLGAVGLPVFSGFKGGFQVLAGPTGGYITGYIVTALLVGFCADHIPGNTIKSTILLFLGCAAGVILCYLFGTIQYMLTADKTLLQGLALCVFPFIPFDLLKCVLACAIGIPVRKRLASS